MNMLGSKFGDDCWLFLHVSQETEKQLGIPMISRQIIYLLFRISHSIFIFHTLTNRELTNPYSDCHIYILIFFLNGMKALTKE